MTASHVTLGGALDGAGVCRELKKVLQPDRHMCMHKELGDVVNDVSFYDRLKEDPSIIIKIIIR